MTKSTKPEKPIYNWAIQKIGTNKMHRELFDARDDARAFLYAKEATGVWDRDTYGVVQIKSVVVKRVRK